MWRSSTSPRHVRPGAEVRGLHRGQPARVPPARVGIHPTPRRATRGLLGGHRPHHQPVVHGAVRRPGEQVGRHLFTSEASYSSVSAMLTAWPYGTGLCRGGVLEPEGTVEIKFRRKDLLKTMRRIDQIYFRLVEQLGEKSQSRSADE